MPRREGHTIYGEVAGYASTADAFRLTDIHDEGRGAVAAISLALRGRGRERRGCRLHQRARHEHQGQRRDRNPGDQAVLGEAARRIPVSSTKSMTGHLIAAGGVVEAIACLLAIRDGVVPPTVNLDNPDDDCDLDYVPHAARERTVNVAMSNSFGFGGQNTTLVLRRYAG